MKVLHLGLNFIVERMSKVYSPFVVGSTVIETERLRLRGWEDTQQDAEGMFTYAQYEKVGRPAGWKYHQSVDESREIVRMFVKDRNVFAITDKESGRIIGSLGLHQPESMEEYEQLYGLEIGYVLSPDNWGKGIMTEAVRAVINWIFGNTDVGILYCGHFTFNDRSRRVIEKCGFTYWKDATYVTEQLGETVDEKIYRLPKSDWQKG